MYAFTLAIGFLFFVSCDQNSVNSPLVGTWKDKTVTPENGWCVERSITFSGNGSFEYRDAAYSSEEASQPHDEMFFSGNYEIKDDVASVHVKAHGWIHDGKKETVEGFEGFDEQMQFSVKGNTLTLVRYYGTADAFTETYTK